MQQDYGYAFFKEWTGPGFPRVIMVTIQHANPYYDDSYAVNSDNLGPYGDAITYELLPYIEKTFRGIGPWARALYGGSTGGWEARPPRCSIPINTTAPGRTVPTRSTSTATPSSICMPIGARISAKDPSGGHPGPASVTISGKRA